QVDFIGGHVSDAHGGSLSAGGVPARSDRPDRYAPERGRHDPFEGEGSKSLDFSPSLHRVIGTALRILTRDPRDRASSSGEPTDRDLSAHLGVAPKARKRSASVPCEDPSADAYHRLA